MDRHISAGSQNCGTPAARRMGAAKTRRGFTLIELLVVMLIMGTLIGLVSTSAQPDDRVVLKLEADRLAQLMELAATESRLSGTSIAWTSTGSVYGFLRFNENAGWTAIVDTVLRTRRLPSGMVIADMRIEGVGAPASMRVEFNSYGAPATFSLAMSLGAVRYEIVNTPVGDVHVVPVQGG